MNEALKRLDVVMRDLAELANYFEGAGLHSDSDRLDNAADDVEAARGTLEALAVFGTGSARSRARRAA